MKVIGIGPYIGDFKEEILTFRPYVKWLSEVLDYDNLYISTHINRTFLYNFIPKSNIIPVYEMFSRNEFDQYGFLHKECDKKDFNLLIKRFKKQILDLENCENNNVEIYYLNYTKNLNNYPYHNKIFNKIEKPDDIRVPVKYKNKIVFIPDRSEDVKVISAVLNYLKNKYENDLIIVGNIESWFSNDNIILKYPDYFTNGWKYIISYILESKCVICPISYWTSICNLQKIPVFSWGINPSQYRPGGLLNFDNDKCFVIPFSKNSKFSILTDFADYFINKVNGDL